MIDANRAMEQSCETVDFYVRDAKMTFEDTFNIKVNDDRIAAAIFMAGYVQSCVKDYETAMQAGVISL